MLGVCPGEAYEADEYHKSHASADEVCVCEDGDIGKLYHVPVPAEPAAKNMREIIGK